MPNQNEQREQPKAENTEAAPANDRAQDPSKTTSPTQAIEAIPPELVTALKDAGLNPAQPEVKSTLEITMLMARGSLPLPPPQILNEYEKLIPGFSRELLEMTKLQGEHRRTSDTERLKRDERRKDRGQVIALVVALAGLALAAAEGAWGNGWVACLIAVVGVGGPLAAIKIAASMGRPQEKRDTSATKPPQVG
jgi:uncharacterized membrane protein